MIAAFRTQDQPIPRVLRPRGFQDADLTCFPRIQNVDGPVPAVLRSGSLRGADRLGVRGEYAHTILGHFRSKHLYAYRVAGQPSGKVSQRCLTAENLDRATAGELTSPYDLSSGRTLIGGGRPDRCRARK